MTTSAGLLVPHRRRAAYGHRVGRAIFRTLYDGRAIHSHRVPAEGPVLLVANHAAFLDGPFVFSLAPRPVTFLVKQEAFRGVFGMVVRGAGQIPIDRTTGDRAALAAALAVLARGDTVGIFPEGTRRDGDVDGVNHGAAWIALRSGAPIVPVAVLGTRVAGASTDSWPRPRTPLTVDFGEPFHLHPDLAVPGRDRLRRASDELRQALASHVRRARVDNGSSS
ncbi:lysophospholipid acyltransferase family protein [Intrasporangium sp. DVR]|uniref:lysophospholipid acyltransferase family protein n=1 Tax=Intrasporangium sp. DVR TaxID=3127867 RepID=UPI00313A724F